MTYFDAHNHLQDETLADRLDAIAAGLEALPVGGMVVNGTCEDDWPRVAALAAKYPWVIPSYGLHPWDTGNRSEHWFARLREHVVADPRAAVGEIGIDRWMLAARPDDPRLAGLRRAPMPEQGEVMLKQLALACSENRAVTIHCIQAWGTLCEVLERVNLPERGFLLHAYAGPAELISRFARLGAFFSFNPGFLPASPDLGDNPRLTHFRLVPEDRLLIETDAPTTTPPGSWRTHSLPDNANHPGNIAAAAAGLAAVLRRPEDEIVALTGENFRRLFGRAPGERSPTAPFQRHT